MLRNKLLSACTVFVLMGLMLAACAGQPQQQQPAATTAPDTAATAEGEAAATAEGAPAATAAPDAAATAEGAPAATAATEGQAAPAASDEPYRIGIFSDLTTVNFWSYLGPNTTVWNSYVLLPQRVALANQPAPNFTLVPQVAESLPERPLQQEGEFFVSEVKLKEGIQWSDGTPLTASDVAFTANTVLELQLPGNWASFFDSTYLDRVEAVDDTTVKFFFKEEPGLGVYEYGGALTAAIMSEAYWSTIVEEAKSAVGAVGDAPGEGASQEERDAHQEKLNEALNVLFNHTPNGEPLAGGFTFSKWEEGAFAENITSPNFFQTGANVVQYGGGGFSEANSGAVSYQTSIGEASGDAVTQYTVGPNVGSAVYTLYSDQNAALLALQNGEIDYLLNSLGLQRGLRAQVEGQEGLTVVENDTNGIRYLGFNTRKKPMDDKAFRQAVAVLIDKEFVTTNVLQGAAYPLYSMVPEGNSFWHSDAGAKFGLKDDGTPMSREERVSEAISILEAAGYSFEGGTKPTWDADNRQVVAGGRLLMPDGQPIPELSILAPSAGYDPLRSTFAQWIGQWLNEFGIPTNVELTGFNVITDRLNQPDSFDMWILGWSLTLFPDYMRDFFHSETAKPGDLNYGAFSSPEYDALSDQLKTCTELDQCQQIAVQTQEALAEELPYVLLFDTGIVEVYNSDILEYPFTESLGGLQFSQGLTTLVALK
jgi:ABC-type transport system substrate-binding protein